jgi:hypothetical protein
MNPVQRKKSPRAPSMALDEAIGRVEKAYGKERLHPAPTEVVAQNLGYKGVNNGAAMSALASLRYYGLLERLKEGFLAVTKDFEHFKFAPDETQRRELLVGFLRKPQLFAELLEKYESGLPSNASLRYELIQRGFSPAAAEGALDTFRRSVEYVGASPIEIAVLAPAPAAVPVPVALTTKSRRSVDVAPLAVAEPIGDSRTSFDAASGASSERPTSDQYSSQSRLDEAPPRAQPSDESSDRIPIRLQGGRRAWLVIPHPFFEADKRRLKAQIDLLLTQDEEGGL